MLLTTVLSAEKCPPLNPDGQVDSLDLDWYATHQRVARLTTRCGRDVGLQLDEACARRGLDAGDILYASPQLRICVDIKPADCLVLENLDIQQAVTLGWQVGNRHTALFAGQLQGQYLLPFDQPLQELLVRLGLPVKRAQARLLPSLQLGAGHGHSHAHS